MSDVSPQTAPFVTPIVAQLLTLGMLVAMQLQAWMILRIANPGAAYLAAATYAAALGRGLRRFSTVQRRDRAR